MVEFFVVLIIPLADVSDIAGAAGVGNKSILNIEVHEALVLREGKFFYGGLKDLMQRER